MRQVIKDIRTCPPEGFRYVHPETGHVTTAIDANTWVAKARAHLEANGLPVPVDLSAQMQDQLCQVLPVGWCEYDDPNRPRVDITFSWGDVERGTRTLFDWLTGGREMVGQAEAERRAKICSTCYLNVQAYGCGQSCYELIRKLAGLLVGKETSVDDRLRNCAACKCFLRSKVHVPLATIEKHDTDSIQVLLPSFCWLKKGGDNYSP